MAKQQKVNKNVVAAMTVVSMIVVVVGAVGLTLSNRTRDPKVFAERAAQMEKKNDLQQAATFYKKAYSINKEVKYLNEAARCDYAIGNIGDMLNILIEANAAAPDDPNVLVYTLDRLWELRRMGQPTPQRMRDTAEKLLALDPNNVLALASQADALTLMGAADAANKPKADEALKKAIALNPNEPHVALLRVDREVTARMADLRAKGETLSKSEQETRVKALRADMIKLLQEALAAHPDDALLSMSLADAYINNQQYDEARKLLESAVAAHESVDLRLGLARFLSAEVERRKNAASKEEQESPAFKSELAELIQQGQQNAGRATELDKAAFDAYTIRARLMRFEAERTGDWERDKVGTEKKLVDWFLKSLDETVGIKSARAALDSNGRIAVLTQGFDLAMNVVRDSTNEEDRKIGLEASRKFYEACNRQFPETYLTAMMKGQMSVVERDLNAAVAAYAKVVEKTAAPEIADTMAGRVYSRMAKEQLSFLYRETGEPGLALKQTDEAIQAYTKANMDLPRRLLLNRGDLLILMKRGTEALDMAEQVLRASPKDVDIQRLKARALALIPGRQEEAQKVLTAIDEAQGGSTGVQMDRVRIAAFQQDWDEAERTLHEVLKNDPNNVEALRLLVQTMNAAQRSDALLAALNELAPRTTDPAVQRLIKAYTLTVSIKDEEQRDVAMLKLINEIPDPAERASELFAHYFTRNNFEQAATALDELEKLRPTDKSVLIQQFTLALQRKQLTRAEQYVTKLAEANADSAHGAVFRGQFKYAAGDYAAALLEFRNAERELPSDADLKVKIATALVTGPEQRFDDALECIKQAIEFNPRHFPARKLRCIIMENLNRFQEAIPDLRVAAELNPNDKYIKEHKEILDEEVDPKIGIARREKLRETKPNDVANLARLAELYSRVNNAAKTEECVKAAVSIEPPSKLTGLLVSRYYVNLYLQNGRSEADKAADRKAVEDYLARLLASTERVPRIEIMMLEARFYEALNEFMEGERIYREADKYADTISQPEEKRTGKLMAASDQAEFYLKIKRYEDSNEAFKRMLTWIKPDDVGSLQACRLKIMKNVLMLRKYSEAEPLIEAYVKEFPNDIRGLMARAELQLAQGRLAEGRESLTRVLQQDARQGWSLLMRGKVNIDLKNYSEAITDLNNCKLAAPTGFNNMHRIELARVYQITDQIDLAEAELNDVFKSAQNESDKADSAMLLVRLYTSSNQLEKAQQWLNTMAASQPNVPNWPYQLGRLFLNRKDYSNAEPHLRKAVELTNFKASGAISDWLTALVRGNRAAEAAAAFEKLDAAVIDPPLRTVGAEAYLKLQKSAQARAQFEQAAGDAARNGLEPLTSVMGRINETAPAETESILTTLLAKFESDPLPTVRLRIALARHLVEKDGSRFAQASEVLDAAAKQAPPRSSELVGVLMGRAHALEQNNQIDEAVRQYEELIKQFDNNAGALNNIAFLLADKKHKAEEAIPYAERARALVPDNADILDTLGWAYQQAGKMQRAESTLIEAVRLDPQNLAAWYHLGQTQEKAGDKAAARKSYKRGLESAKTNAKLDSVWGKRLEEAAGKLGN